MGLEPVIIKDIIIYLKIIRSKIWENSVNFDYFNYPYFRRSNVSKKFCRIFGNRKK